jgi:hypothetical protein
MRLLKRSPSGKFCLTKNFDEDIPKYAILSHTWGSNDDEVNYEDFKQGTASCKAGYAKIEFCGEQAARDGLDYFWVDTCCIDKSSSTELQQSISSMFRWYRDAAKCYVYLADVSSSDSDDHDRSNSPAWVSEFCRSRWFQRGWTLQELIAPRAVIFFDQNGARLGDKEILIQHICELTGIAETALLGQKSLQDFNFSERYDWAIGRETKYGEDWAYCLQGIFGVCFSPLYTEGKDKAVSRLVEEIKKDQLGIEIQRPVIGMFTALKHQIHSSCSLHFIDAEKHDQILNPLVLDIALLETKIFFGQVKEKDDRHRSKIINNAQTLTANDIWVSAMQSTFIAFLQQILVSIFFPSYIRDQLNRQLDLSSTILSRAIDSNKRIASDLRHDKETVQETLSKLNKVQDFIRVVIEPDGGQLRGSSTQGIQQQDAECAKLRYEGEKLSTQVQELKVSLQETNAQVEAQEIHATNGAQKYERVRDDVDRNRREYANRTLLQEIWAWIKWLMTLGSGN